MSPHESLPGIGSLDPQPSSLANSPAPLPDVDEMQAGFLKVAFDRVVSDYLGQFRAQPEDFGYTSKSDLISTLLAGYGPKLLLMKGKASVDSFYSFAVRLIGNTLTTMNTIRLRVNAVCAVTFNGGQSPTVYVAPDSQTAIVSPEQAEAIRSGMRRWKGRLYEELIASGQKVRDLTFQEIDRILSSQTGKTSKGSA